MALLLLSTVVVGHGGAVSPAPRDVVPATNATCPGSTVPSSYSGTLSIEGGPLPASDAVGVPLSYNYSADVEVSNRNSGVLVSSSCDEYDGTASTGANGSFSFDLTLSSSHCYGDECTRSLGPYGPISVGPSGAPPAGYEVLVGSNGTSLTLTFAAELGGLALSPEGASRTLSTSAPGTFVAQPVTATGASSPIAPTFVWNLTGAGWSWNGSGTTGTVEALPGAGLGELSVAASAEVGSNRFSVGPVLVDLEAVTTAFTGSDANRTDLDVGGTVAFTAEGSGAPGYSYSADASPGLGLGTVVWPCSTNASTGEAVTVACTGTVTYPSAGVAEPTVELTNSYSSAEGALPPITVAPLPAIALAPGSPVGYAGVPLSIRVAAVAGSGTPPYTLACLDPGSGPAECATSPGPNWTFTPTYTDPGTYSAHAWVVDRDGTNRSVAFGVTVVAPLALGAIAAPSGMEADAPTQLSATLSGGDLPAQYWWNVSSAPGPVASGRVAADGPLAATWLPTLPGTVEVSLSVIDALGTREETTALVNVGPAVATRLEAVTVPGAEPTVAGTPVSVVWQAVDLQGAAVTGFAATGSVELVGSGAGTVGTTYVNTSGGGPLTETTPGAFVIPSAAWQLGRLALTAASTHVGVFQLQLSGGSLLDGTGPLEVEVVADLAHLHLYDPTVALAGPRDNQTFWRVADEYGNPPFGAAVDILYSSEGTSSEAIVPVVAAGSGAVGVWVNFTAPNGAGGSLEVTDAAGTVLLGPIAIPPTGSGATTLSVSVLTIATAVPVGAVGLGLTAWAQRRRRALVPGDERPPDDELRRLVEGRDGVVALVREVRALDLPGLEAAWNPSPAPAELADWVASLVADGTLGARIGPDGVARFCFMGSADGPPVVLLDPGALDRATAARRELTEETGSDASGRSRGD